jgi:hypothetical protein
MAQKPMRRVEVYPRALRASHWLESVFTYNFNFAVYLGYRNITFFHIGRL